MDDKATLETLNHFFKVHGISTHRCHEPSEQCEKPRFVMATTYYDALPQDHKDAICRFYVETVFEDAEGHEDERLYLF